MHNPKYLLILLFLIAGCAAHRPALLPPVTSSAEFFDLTATRYDSLHNQEVRASVDLTIDGVRERRASALVRLPFPLGSQTRGWRSGYCGHGRACPG